MATHNITINEEGKLAPNNMGEIRREDIVSFHVGSKPILLCLNVQIFGTESRLEIAAEDSVALRVKPNAPLGDFVYSTCIHDANTVNSTCADVKREVENPNTDYQGDSGRGSVGM